MRTGRDRRRGRAPWRALCAAAALAVASAAAAAYGADDSTPAFLEREIRILSGARAPDLPAEFRNTKEVRDMLGVRSRLSGTEGCDKAAAYVKWRFRQIGLENITEQPFDVIVPITERCSMTLELPDGKREVQLYPLWPNWVRTCSTPGPITCPVVYVGDGSVSKLNGLPIEGSIVVMEHNTGAAWQFLGQFAPRAILFVEPEGEEATRRHAEMKFLRDPVNLPRFWVPRRESDPTEKLAAADLVRAVVAAQRPTNGESAPLKATLDCRVVWRKRTARNLFGFLKGTEGTAHKGHFVAFSAHYDSMSIAPDLAPGADGASSMAALLRLAAQLSKKENRPREGVLFIATAGHYQALKGGTMLADAMRFSTTLPADGCRRETDEIRRRVGTLLRKPLYWKDLRKECSEIARQTGAISGLDKAVRAKMLKQVEAVTKGAAMPAPAAGEPEDLGREFGDLVAVLGYDPQPALKELLKILEGDELSERMRTLEEDEIDRSDRVDAYEELAEEIRETEALEPAEAQAMLEQVDILKSNITRTTSSYNAYSELFRLIKAAKDLSPGDRRTLRFAAEHEQDSDRHIAMHRFELVRLRKHAEFLNRLKIDLNKRLRLLYSLELCSDGWRFGLFAKGGMIQQNVSDQNVYGGLMQRVWQLGRKGLKDGRLYERVIYPAKEAERLSGKTNSYFSGVTPAFDGEPVQLGGRQALALATVDSARRRVDTPTDTVRYIRKYNGFALLGYQTDVLCEVVQKMSTDDQIRDLHKTLDQERASGKSALTEYACRVHGRAVLYDIRESMATADMPQPGALCTSRYGSTGEYSRGTADKSYAGVRDGYLTFADEGGTFEVLSVPHDKSRMWNMKGFDFRAYRFDEETGDVTHAPDLGPQGDKQFKISHNVARADYEVTCAVFRCRGVTLFGLVNATTGTHYTGITLYDAKTNTTPDFYGTAYYPLPRVFTHGYPSAVIFVQPKVRFKAQLTTGPLGATTPVLNVRTEHLAKDGEAQGIGYGVPPHGILPNSRYRMTRDVFNLDEYRKSSLAEHAVENNRVNELHDGKRDEEGNWVLDGARQYLERAEKHLAAKEYDKFFVDLEGAFATETRAYPIVKGTTTDILTGVLFYLFLLLPFSYFGERLLFGFPDVNRRIVAFFGIFIVVFLILAMVHPAFAITQSAPVILIAFITLALSLLVIAMIRGRFELEIKRLHERPGARRQADFKRMSATSAACALGIGNMRRRKTRTTLTLVTLVLLTFSVLSFTSVDPRQITHENPNPTGTEFTPAYPGVLLRHHAYLAVPMYLYNLTLNEFQDEADVVPRAWLGTDVLVQHGGTTDFHKEFLCPGVVGMRPDDPAVLAPRQRGGLSAEDWLRQLISAGRWFTADDREPGCIVGQKVAAEVGITPDQVKQGVSGEAEAPRVRMLGVTLPVIGIINDEKFKGLKDIDGEELSPTDRRKESWMKRSGKTFDPYQVESYIHVEPENCVFVPFDFLMDYGASLMSIDIIPHEVREAVAAATADERAEAWAAADARAKDIGVRLLSRLTIPIYISSEGAVTYKLSSDANRVRGLGAMIVPMLICALIVLNTMLGSVYERQREISILGSLGLAPVHIGSLFVAESAVFATIAVILGYVMGQTTSFLLTRYDVLAGFSLNYSSTSAVISAGAVMALVLLSSIYPARKASQLSVPDVERIWKLPEPEGDHFYIKFPFTIGGEQAYGINMFLLEYFRDHANQSVGDFFAQDSGLTFEQVDGQDVMRFDSQVWIAPFDFGISQSLSLYTVPTDEEGIYAPEMHLYRKSGGPAAWARMNHKFLKLIRQQFLMWRILSTEEREYFSAQAKLHLGIGTDQDRETVATVLLGQPGLGEETADASTDDEKDKDAPGEET